MKTPLSLAAAAASVFLQGAAPALAASQWVKVNGIGAKADCANLVEWRDKDKASYEKALQWELGYISSAALNLPKIDPMKNLEEEEEDVVRWLSNFCTNHLELNLSEVADKFIKDHRRN